MIQQRMVKEILNIEVDEQEYKKIEELATLHGNTINDYVLESIRERMRHESEDDDLLMVTSSINPVLNELWDNEMDAAYDEL